MYFSMSFLIFTGWERKFTWKIADPLFFINSATCVRYLFFKCHGQNKTFSINRYYLFARVENILMWFGCTIFFQQCATSAPNNAHIMEMMFSLKCWIIFNYLKKAHTFLPIANSLCIMYSVQRNSIFIN